MKFRIAGKVWNLHLVPRSSLRNKDGLCVYETQSLLVYDKLQGRHKLETLVHEVTHASFPDLSEEAVERFAADVARILWRCGFSDGKTG